jgi:hypothetical protein
MSANPKPKFRPGDRVVELETGERGTIIAMPRDLVKQIPECVVVLLDGETDGFVYHKDDVELVEEP